MGATRDSCSSNIHVLFLSLSPQEGRVDRQGSYIDAETVICCLLGASKALISARPMQRILLLLLKLKEEFLPPHLSIFYFFFSLPKICTEDWLL